jgi:hypothetical protein
MKTLFGIIVGLILLSLISCVEPNVGYPVNHPESTDSTKKDSLNIPRNIEVEFSSIPLTVVVIDSCEYLYGPWGNGTVLCHKGNCKNHQSDGNQQ